MDKTMQDWRSLIERMKELPKSTPPFGEQRSLDDYGQCIPNCPICHGIGWLGKDLPVGHPDFGEMEPCPNQKMVGWDDSIGITKEEAMALNWEDHIPTDAVVQMKAEMMKILNRGYGWIYIHGEPGIGKTLMGKSFAVYASVKSGFKTRYRKHTQIINELRSTYDEERGQVAYREMLDFYKEIPVLVVDELGRDRATDFSKSSLSDLIDYRYEMATRKKEITLFISNFSPEDILEPYQFSRIRDNRGLVMKVESSDLRPGMTYEKHPESYRLWWMDD